MPSFAKNLYCKNYLKSSCIYSWLYTVYSLSEDSTYLNASGNCELTPSNIPSKVLANRKIKANGAFADSNPLISFKEKKQFL